MARVVPASPDSLRDAAELLRAGELVCFPTETVYGLGGDASDPEAVRRIFAAKGRPADHPLIVHLFDGEQVERWAKEVPESARVLAERFWPGPLTVVLQRHGRVPLEVTGGQETVALRVPGHPVARGLLEEFGGGVAAPSANRFGRISPTTARHAESELGDRVALVLDGGPTEVGVESTIVDLSGEGPRLLRPGMIGRRRLAEVLGVSGYSLDTGHGPGLPRVPGALERHYSPASPVELLDPDRLASRLEKGAGGREERVSVLSSRPAPAGFRGRWLQLPGDAHGYARGLYAALRELDELGLPILVEAPPRDEAWEAVNDRLLRASARPRAVAEEGRK